MKNKRPFEKSGGSFRKISSEMQAAQLQARNEIGELIDEYRTSLENFHDLKNGHVGKDLDIGYYELSNRVEEKQFDCADKILRSRYEELISFEQSLSLCSAIDLRYVGEKAINYTSVLAQLGGGEDIVVTPSVSWTGEEISGEIAMDSILIPYINYEQSVVNTGALVTIQTQEDWSTGEIEIREHVSSHIKTLPGLVLGRMAIESYYESFFKT